MSSETKSWIRSIILALAIGLAIRTFIFGITNVNGQSMMNTLHDGDTVFINKIDKWRDNLNRDDVIIFNSPIEDEIYIKRIIGLPGDRIELSAGKLYVNGELKDETYINFPMTEDEPDGSWTLNEDQIFVMGDNRIPGASADSRLFGPIEKSSVIGVAKYIFLPRKDAGRL